MAVNKDYFKKALKTAVVPLEDGQEVKIKALTARDHQECSKSCDPEKDSLGYCCMVVAKSAIDDDGNYLFTPEEVLDLPAEIMLAIVDAANELNGLKKKN